MSKPITPAVTRWWSPTVWARSPARWRASPWVRALPTCFPKCRRGGAGQFPERQVPGLPAFHPAVSGQLWLSLHRAGHRHQCARPKHQQLRRDHYRPQPVGHQSHLSEQHGSGQSLPGGFQRDRAGQFRQRPLLGGAPRYQFVQDIFGFSYGSGASGSSASLPPTEPSSQMHYITARHPTNDLVAFRSSINLPGITVPAGATTLA